MKCLHLATAACLLAAYAGLADATPLIFEAESAVDVDGVFEFVRDPAMSGSLGLQVREGMGSDFDENQASQLKALHSRVGFAADGGRATYRFHVPEGGHYWVWARTYWLWECSNSFWVGKDANSSILLTDKIHERWHWVRAEKQVALDTGTAEFTISNREDGIQIDQFCLTLERQFRPEGILNSNVLIPRAEVPPPLLLRPVLQAPVVFPDADTTLTLWIRNPAGHARTVTLFAACDATLELEGPAEQTIELPARSGLVDAVFRVRERRGGHPLQRSQVHFRVETDDGDPVSASCDLVHAFPWEAAGPFQHFSRNDPRPPLWQQADETTAAPSTAALQELTWRPVASPGLLTGSGRVNLQRVFDRQSTTSWGYLRAQIEWARDEDIPAELRSDDQSILWVNGVFVAAHRVIGPGERYYTRCSLPFKQGANTILIAVNQMQAFWEASLMPVPTTVGGVPQRDR